MKLGFVGTGDITKAIVTGLDRAGHDYAEILVSQRNAEISAHLARSCARVRVVSDNQLIVDEADLVVLAVRPQVAEQVIPRLTFRPGQIVVTLIAMITPEKLSEWTGPGVDVVKATPLPFVARGMGVTPIRPDHPEAARLFGLLGKVIPVADQDMFEALTVSGTFMGTFFGVQEALVDWLGAKGVEKQAAQTYLAGVLLGLAQTGMDSTEEDLAHLRKEHCTPGGLNEQMFEVFQQEGGLDAFMAGIESVYGRVRRAKPSE